MTASSSSITWVGLSFLKLGCCTDGVLLAVMGCLEEILLVGLV